MVEFIIESYTNEITVLNEDSSDNNLIILEKYFFNYVNDSRKLSLDIIKKFNLFNKDLNPSNQANKTKNTINITDYFSIPFLIIQKILDSIDGKACVIGRIKLGSLLW